MPIDTLDATLPKDLQDVVTFQETTPQGESAMATDATGTLQGIAMDTMTPDKVKAIAADLLKQADQEKAVAAKIQSLTDEGAKAKRDMETAIAEQLKLSTELASGATQITDLKAQLATASAKQTELETANKAMAKQLKTIETEKAIATRVQALAALKIDSKDRVAKFTAINEAGEFAINDEMFNLTVAEFKSVMEQAAASVTAAAAAPVTAPAKTEVTPAAPDLSAVTGREQAIAQLAAGQETAATESGRSKYARTFGAGV